MFSSKDLFFTPASTGYTVSKSLRFRASASAYLNRTQGVATNGFIWTWSAWVKRGSLGSNQVLFCAGAPTNTEGVQFIATDVIQIFRYTGTYTIQLDTTQVFRDPSAWYHLVVANDVTQATASNRIKFYVNGSQVTSFTTATYPPQNTQYEINNNGQAATIGRYSAAASSFFDGYLAEVNFIDGSALTPSSFGAFDTNGVWQPVQYTGSYGTNGFYLPFTDNSGSSSNLFNYSEQFDNAYWGKNFFTITANSTTAPNGTSTADSMLETAVSNLHATTANGGTGVTVVSGATYTFSIYVKPINKQFIQLVFDNAITTSGGYANFDIINGTVTLASNYGTGAGASGSIANVGNGWFRIALTTSIGAFTASRESINGITSGTSAPFEGYLGNVSNGYYLWGAQFEQASSAGMYLYVTNAAQASTLNFGKDYSVTTGGYNNWVSSNLSNTTGPTYDSMIDSPTNYADGGNGRGNYAVLNPLNLWQSSASTSVTNGNLTCAASSAGTGGSAASVGISSGKFYWETEFTTIPGGNFCGAGLYDMSVVFGGANSYVRTAHWILSDLGLFYANGAAGTASGTGAFSAGNIARFAFDGDTGKLWVGKDNTWIGTPGTSGEIATLTIGKTYAPLVTMYYSGSSGVTTSNFGQRPFTYTPPSGFSALNTQNLTTPTITNGAQNFDISLYTGTASPQNVTNSGSFQPDFAWFKTRSTTGTPPNNSNQTFNSLTPYEVLYTDNTNAAFNPGTAWFTFANNGVSLTSSTQLNNNTTPFVLWQWKAGGATPTSGTGTGGITNVQYSANINSGFSVVTYTGSGTAGTVTHGLGAAPSMVITKKRSSAGDAWVVWHTSLSGGNFILTLNTTAAQFASTQYTAVPSSTVLNLNTATAVNNNGSTYVSYVFAPIAGYSAFGSYTANASTDGPMVFTNFRPRFVLLKNTTRAADWIIYDSSRDLYNTETQQLYPNLSSAEASGANIDFLSNGFKIRAGSGSGINNTSGDVYIYAAFAENPFKISRAR